MVVFKLHSGSKKRHSWRLKESKEQSSVTRHPTWSSSSLMRSFLAMVIIDVCASDLPLFNEGETPGIRGPHQLRDAPPAQTASWRDECLARPCRVPGGAPLKWDTGAVQPIDYLPGNYHQSATRGEIRKGEERWTPGQDDGGLAGP